jgi:hypothetical protein
MVDQLRDHYHQGRKAEQGQETVVEAVFMSRTHGGRERG